MYYTKPLIGKVINKVEIKKITLPNDGAPKAPTLFACIETELYPSIFDELPKIHKVDNKSVKAKDCLKIIILLNEGVSQVNKIFDNFLIDEGKANPHHHSIFTKDPKIPYLNIFDQTLII